MQRVVGGEIPWLISHSKQLYNHVNFWEISICVMCTCIIYSCYVFVSFWVWHVVIPDSYTLYDLEDVQFNAMPYQINSFFNGYTFVRVHVHVQYRSQATTCVCSQNPRDCASSTRGRVYTAHERKYFTRSYVLANCEYRACMHEHCEQKYYRQDRTK